MFGMRRSLLLPLLSLVACGEATPQNALERWFPDKAQTVLSTDDPWTQVAGRFVHRPHTGDAVEAAEAAFSNGRLALELPERGEGDLRLSVPGLAVRVRELGARGEGRRMGGSVAYERVGGWAY